MKKIKSLTQDEQNTLENANKKHPSTRVRLRAQIILLSNQGYKLKEIADICRITRQTASTTINRWEKSGLLGMYDAPRPGQPPVLTSEDIQFVYDMVESEPRSINIIMASLEDQRGKTPSRTTIKRVIKKKIMETDSKIS